MKPLKLLVFFMFFQIGISQQIPPLKSYFPSDYSADNQNWSISQDDFGIIYVANTRGLLTYNGAAWKLYDTPNGSEMRSVKVIKKRIYVGFYMDFGYYEKDDKGILEYTSLSDSFKNELLEDEQFWQIEHYKDWILFRSLRRIYLYNTLTNTYKKYTAKNNINNVSVFDDGIYYHVSNEGIYTLQEGKEKLFSAHPIVMNNKFINLFLHPEGLLGVTDKSGIYIISKGLIKPFNDSLNDVLKTKVIYTTLQLKNNNLAIGTISDGLLLLDESGNIINYLNQEKGLSNNTILSLYEDSKNTLWLGTDYGVNYINTSSLLRVYHDERGKLGTIYDAVKYEGHLYLGTNQGLFYMADSSSQRYELISNTAGQVWSLFEYDGTLFCGHDSGTFIIKEGQASKISNEAGSWVFRELIENPNLLLQGNYDGIHVLEKERDVWRYKRKIKGFGYSSQFFEVIGNKILVNHEFKGVYELEFNKDFKEFTSVKRIDSFQISQKSALSKYKDQVYYASRQGFYSYDSKSVKFIRNDAASTFIYDDFVSGRMSINEDGIWMFTNEALINLKQGQLSKELEFKKIQFPSILFSSMKGFQKLSKLDSENYLIGSTNGFTLTDLNKSKQDEEFEVFINEVSNYTDSGSFLTRLSLTSKQKFHYKNNSFKINYSAPYYNAINPVLYQTRLLGGAGNWTNWSTNHSISYEYLPNGDYVFEVRAKSGKTVSSNVSTYHFIINKPWYFSNTMLALYVFGILLFSLFMHNVYKFYYKKQRENILLKSQKELELKKLENEQQLMRFENEKLQQDVDNKNRELAISTMSLIKKNEFLSSIKDQLKSATDDKMSIKPVLKIIDKNLNNTDDWKFFQEAFNNADSDFLKKVKAIHPLLTPNDLRLCAYLRLNLSSKEIAPLLNISHRSVEIKRYRLRKKIELPHESSLVNYILEI